MIARPVTAHMLARLPGVDEAPATAALAGDYASTVRPLLSTYCFSCHGGAKHRGDVRLDTLDHSLPEMMGATG
jgi:hypothetical protein